MCFRPADTGGGIVCPNCGKKINSTMGAMPSKCPFCKTSLDEVAEAAPTPSATGAPNVPSAPGMPKVPGAPSVPDSNKNTKLPGMP